MIIMICFHLREHTTYYYIVLYTALLYVMEHNMWFNISITNSDDRQVIKYMNTNTAFVSC